MNNLLRWYTLSSALVITSMMGASVMGMAYVVMEPGPFALLQGCVCMLCTCAVLICAPMAWASLLFGAHYSESDNQRDRNRRN